MTSRQLSLLIVTLFALAAAPAPRRAAKRAASTRPATRPATAPAKSATADTPAKLRRDVERYAARSSRMTPNRAARAWLALADRQSHLLATSPDSPDAITFDDLLTALPPPPAWNALAKAIDARPLGQGPRAARPLCLRWLAHNLTGNRAAQEQDLSAMESLAPQLSQDVRPTFESTVASLNAAFVNTASTPDELATRLTHRLAFYRKFPQPILLQLPDLVARLGPEVSEPLLRDALTIPQIEIDVPAGATETLARRLTLELIDTIPSPKWQLCCSLDSADLFRAMEKRFPENHPAAADILSKIRGDKAPGNPNGVPDQDAQPNPTRRTAREYDLLSLIADGNTTEAADLARDIQKETPPLELPDDPLRTLDQSGKSPVLFNFVSQLFAETPDLPLWQTLSTLADRTGQPDKLIVLATTTLTRNDLDDGTRSDIRGVLAAALLAADKIDQAADVMRAEIAVEVKNADLDRILHHGDLAIHLARLGRALDRPDWTDQGLAAAQAILDRLKDHGFDARQQDLAAAVADLLEQTGRAPDAAAVLLESLARAARPQPKDDDDARFGDEPSDTTPAKPRQDLVDLAGIYHRAQRHADVLELLDKLPQWAAPDLSEIAAETDYTGAPLGYIAADALAHTGRRDDALKVLYATLYSNPAYDPSYSLLLDLAGEEASKLLDGLIDLESFSPRPLIWKAELLRRLNQLIDAQAAARAAVAMDPGDNDRVAERRADSYGVLAEILTSAGRKTDAAPFRSRAQARRLADEADKLYDLGLRARGIAKDQQSLRAYPDFYASHARLAVELSRRGDRDPASDHARLALHLLPGIITRFDTLQITSDLLAVAPFQPIADDLLTAAAKATPKDARAQYALALLRDTQDRYADALAAYRRAAELDPDFISAWRSIESLASDTYIPPPQRDAATFAILHLDPARRHVAASLNQVSDLRALWTVSETASRNARAAPADIYPLAAAKADLAAAGNQTQAQTQTPTPAETIADHAAISPLPDLLDSLPPEP